MKKIQQLLLLSVITLGILTACGSGGEKKAEGGEHGTEAAAGGAEQHTAGAGTIQVDAAKLAGLKDVVCGMELKAEALGDTLTHEGKLHGFCSPACKAEFLKDPKKYSAAH